MNTARFLALRVLLLVALGFSSMLAVDAYYDVGEATFCSGEHAGCEAVKLSALSRPFGVPLAYVGLTVFAGLMALTFGGSKFAPMFRLTLLAAGVGGAGLLAYQAFVLEAFCELCVVVDVTIVAAAAVGLPRNLSFPAPPLALPTGAWILLSALAVAAPGVYQRLPEPRPIPEFVRNLRAEKGVTIVEVADFACKHCRTLQRTMAAALEGRSDVTLRRVIVPATGHPLAQSAATLYRCAERLGIAEDFAMLLSDDQMFSEGTSRWLAELSAHQDELKRCSFERDVRDSVVEDRRAVRAAGIEGIPMTYIGDTVLRGAVSEDRLERAIRLESLGISPHRYRRPLPFLLGVLALASLILVPAVSLATKRAKR